MSYYHQIWPTPTTPERFAAGSIAAKKAEEIGRRIARDEESTIDSTFFADYSVEFYRILFSK